jgi:hypothetical protein
MVDRNPRDLSSRDKSQRKTAWKPPNLLPDPNPVDGIAFRWVRTATLGNSDASNVSSQLRGGWEPVPAEDVPEIQVMPDRNSRFPGMVEIGGLLLCRTTAENFQAERDYKENQAAVQMAAIDANLLRESDPRMPIHRPERKTSVTIGSGKPR